MRIHALTTKDRFPFRFSIASRILVFPMIETYKVGVEKILTFQGLKGRDVVQGHFNITAIFLGGYSSKLTDNSVMEVMQLF